MSVDDERADPVDVRRDGASVPSGALSAQCGGAPDATEESSSPSDERTALDLQELFSDLYDSVRAIAHRACAGLEADAIVQPTAIVHEVYIKVATGRKGREYSGAHLRALAARAVRQVIASHIRTHRTRKRGNGVRPLSLLDTDAGLTATAVDLLEIEEGLVALACKNPRCSNVFEARAYGGMTAGEVATWLGVSKRTVEVDYRFARAFLAAHVSRDD